MIIVNWLGQFIEQMYLSNILRSQFSTKFHSFIRKQCSLDNRNEVGLLFWYLNCVIFTTSGVHWLVPWTQLGPLIDFLVMKFGFYKRNNSSKLKICTFENSWTWRLLILNENTSHSSFKNTMYKYMYDPTVRK